jgi:Protein of unknown function (DUF4232)
MSRSHKPLVMGATVLSVLNLASLSPATRLHAALTPLPAADPCTAPLPASRVLPVASGIQTYTELIGGGLTFHLNQFGPQGLNATVRRLGITPPAGDAVATWSLALPRGARTYSGLTHVFARGAQEHICVQGIAYLNLGNGSSAATAPTASVHLDGIFTSPTAPLITATSGRVSVRIDNASYHIFGKALATTSTSVGVPSTSCDTSQLTITPSRSSAGVGHVGIQFHVRNPSPQYCPLTGYPTVVLLDAGRRPLPTFLHDGSGYLSGNRLVRMVRLGPDGDAYFVVEWVHIPSNGQTCPTAPTLLIVPPAASTNTALVSVRGGVDACGGRLTVSPVEPTPFNF